MNALKIGLLTLALICPISSHAESPVNHEPAKRTVSGNDILIDMALRPAGFIATVAPCFFKPGCESPVVKRFRV